MWAFLRTRGDILRYTDIGRRAFLYTSPPYGPGKPRPIDRCWGVGRPALAVLSYCFTGIWHTTLSRDIVTVFYYEAREREARAFGSWLQGRKADVQSESQCAVYTGTDWSLTTLAPTPTATLQKKYKRTENSARTHFIEGNNNQIIFVGLCN